MYSPPPPPACPPSPSLPPPHAPVDDDDPVPPQPSADVTGDRTDAITVIPETKTSPAPQQLAGLPRVDFLFQANNCLTPSKHWDKCL